MSDSFELRYSWWASMNPNIIPIRVPRLVKNHPIFGWVRAGPWYFTALGYLSDDERGFLCDYWKEHVEAHRKMSARVGVGHMDVRTGY